MPSPFKIPTFDPHDFITTPQKFNWRIPANIDLVCGDPLPQGVGEFVLGAGDELTAHNLTGQQKLDSFGEASFALAVARLDDGDRRCEASRAHSHEHAGIRRGPAFLQ